MRRTSENITVRVAGPDALAALAWLQRSWVWEGRLRALERETGSREIPLRQVPSPERASA